MFFANWLGSLRRVVHRRRVSRRERRASVGQTLYEARLEPRIESLERRQLLTADFVDPNPSPNNGFGQSMVPLSTGNVVVTSPRADVGGTDTGAVYLFNGTTGELISSLFGSRTGDFADTFIVPVGVGNFVVVNPSWDNGSASNAGAVTWMSGTAPVTQIVSAANSLVGTTPGDFIGSVPNDDGLLELNVVTLANGNYLVASPYWNNGSVRYAGAVTWGNGASGIVGPVSATNSLVGTTEYDMVGYRGEHRDDGRYFRRDSIFHLAQGNYVVRTPYWDNGTVRDAGAVTWGNGATGTVGAISAANSLVGTTERDQVGSFFNGEDGYDLNGVIVLPNGNYLVASNEWDHGAIEDAGAVTWGSGTSGVSGAVSIVNSSVGQFENEYFYYRYVPFTLDDTNRTFSVHFHPAGKFHVGSQDTGFATQDAYATVVDGVLKVDGSFNRGSDIRVTRDAARSEFVVRAYDGAVVTEEFRFATSSVTGGLVANLGGGADRFDASGVSLATTIRGGGGNDSIVGSSGNDLIEGDLGDDFIKGGTGRDVLIGGGGNDRLNGQGGADTITGGAGDDCLIGGDGIDVLNEEADVNFTLTRGNLQGQGTDRLAQFEKAILTGGDNENVLDASGSKLQVTLIGGGGDDILQGGSRSDLLDGGYGSDMLVGNAGHDTISGGSGNDIAFGGTGNDCLLGEAGDDTLFGDAGNDQLLGGLDIDTLVGGLGKDSLDGVVNVDRIAGE